MSASSADFCTASFRAGSRSIRAVSRRAAPSGGRVPPTMSPASAENRRAEATGVKPASTSRSEASRTVIPKTEGTSIQRCST